MLAQWIAYAITHSLVESLIPGELVAGKLSFSFPSSSRCSLHAKGPALQEEPGASNIASVFGEQSLARYLAV